MFGLNFDFVSIYVRVGNKNNKLKRYSRSYKGDFSFRRKSCGGKSSFLKKRKRGFVRDRAKLMGKYESGTITKCYFCKVKTDKLSVDIWSAFSLTVLHQGSN